MELLTVANTLISFKVGDFFQVKSYIQFFKTYNSNCRIFFQ